MIQMCFTRGCYVLVISAHDAIQMWMNVWTVVTGAIRMLTVQMLMVHTLVCVVSVIVEMGTFAEVRLSLYTVLVQPKIFIKLCDSRNNVAM